jgi:hypothetical protein
MAVEWSENAIEWLGLTSGVLLAVYPGTGKFGGSVILWQDEVEPFKITCYRKLKMVCSISALEWQL